MSKTYTVRMGSISIDWTGLHRASWAKFWRTGEDLTDDEHAKFVTEIPDPRHPSGWATFVIGDPMKDMG